MVPPLPLFLGFMRSIAGVRAAEMPSEKVDLLSQAVRDQFGGGHLHLRRDEHSLDIKKGIRGISETRSMGRLSAPDTPEVQWIAFDWTTPQTLEEAAWGIVHWRFYANGLIAFHAEMSNTSGAFDTGDLQGHRIELRTADGFLLGAWHAGFFVRRGTLVKHYYGSLEENYLPLKMHFVDLAEHQEGQWFCD
jgi:hypothetical protein